MAEHPWTLDDYSNDIVQCAAALSGLPAEGDELGMFASHVATRRDAETGRTR